MPSMRIDLPEDIYWYVYAWGARNELKAYQQAEQLIIRAVEQDREVNQDTAPEADVA
jgi:hypothetical protein